MSLAKAYVSDQKLHPVLVFKFETVCHFCHMQPPVLSTFAHGLYTVLIHQPGESPAYMQWFTLAFSAIMLSDKVLA